MPGASRRLSAPYVSGDRPVAMKPNYFQHRADRTRAKEHKKQEKLQKREEETARRKAEREKERGAEDTSSNRG
jgi:hypothetical protein